MAISDYCWPLVRAFDIDRLRAEVDALVNRLVTPDKNDTPIHTLNLTHLPGLEGADRWWQYRAGHEDLQKLDVDEANFSVVNTDLIGSYISLVMATIRFEHQLKFGTPFKGRCQLVWIKSGTCHAMHIDPHTPHRYHVPIHTHKNCMWLFRQQDQIVPYHMPAAGGVWYVNPTKLYHAVANMSPVSRCHLLMTTG